MSVGERSEPAIGRLVGGPAGLRELLERAGPTFVKIGQFLALRPDLVRQEYADELMRLLDRAPTFPYADVRDIVAEDLGGEPDEIFSYFNRRPVAAGSLAQTHLARLEDGAEVAVKILRPNIRTQVLRDLKRARLMARILDLTGVSLVAAPTDVVDELSQWLLQEIDFERELRNLLRLGEVAAGSAVERIPHAYPGLCSDRIVTAEYLRGIPVAELLVAVRTGRPVELDRIAAANVDLDLLAETLIEATFRQIFRYRFFHADLHPGNLVALSGNVLGYVDFGLCDSLDERVRQGQLRYLSAIYSQDVALMFDALTEILVPGEQTDVAAFRRDFSRETNVLLARIQSESDAPDGGRTRPAERSPIGRWMVEVLRIARRHDYRLSPRVLSMYRALLTAETVAQQLGGSADLRSVGRRFFMRLRREEELRALDPENLLPAAVDVVTLFRDSPRQLNQILAALTDGRFVLNVSVNEGGRSSRARRARARLVASAVLAVSVAVLLSVSSLPSVGGIGVEWPLGVVLAGLYVLAFVQWRRLR